MPAASGHGVVHGCVGMQEQLHMDDEHAFLHRYVQLKLCAADKHTVTHDMRRATVAASGR